MKCPFLDNNYPHCSRYMNMQHLEQAFEWCLSHYMDCPIYLELVTGALEPEKSQTVPTPT